MASYKILGLDLGTNSIGWAIRDMSVQEGNQIIDYGVTIFRKGVGDGKSGEYSLAAERRKNRGRRRLYNAKRYRKWELLKVLIENNMCPLTMQELRLWSVGNWKTIDGKKKNSGRIYPLQNENFQKWLAFDPAYFGEKASSEKGRSERKNPYDLRYELIRYKEKNEAAGKLKIGRALYHLVQRRGFRSNRKNGKSVYAENEELQHLKSEDEHFHIATLAKQMIDAGKRFRASGVIQRKYFEEEFYAICKMQDLPSGLTDKLYGAMYYVRPLRSQKGLVGNCTLESKKPRIPVSHPKFEEFRALSFINNIKWREAGSGAYEPLPMPLKKRIFEELFFRRLESGKNKGKVTSDNYFRFEEIINRYSEGGKYEFNYKNKPSVATCPTIADLMNVFDEEWQNKFIEDDDKYGINWHGLTVNYAVKYGNPGKIGKLRRLRMNEIWHILFDYIQTKDQQEELVKFAMDVLGFDNKKAKDFSEIDIQQGYGSFSYNAIDKILPYLQDGTLYSDAVMLANLKKVLGNSYEAQKAKAKALMIEAIKETDSVKEERNIVNGLIQQYLAEFGTRVKGLDDHIREEAARETNAKLIEYFGEAEWCRKSKEEQERLKNNVLHLYLKFLDGRQEPDEKISNGSGNKPPVGYYKLPRIDDVIKYKLKNVLNVDDESLKHLYHHSDIEMYPKSKSDVLVWIQNTNLSVRQLESPQPPSKGLKNPMAMRTLHELRKLLNYLLRIGKIDPHTRVVVEMARELNDANKRWAIETYQRYREEENKEFAKAIVAIAREKYSNLNENDIENINKVRLWWEQIENNEELYREVKALKEDIEKYRLWKEQECLCIYTGKMISLTNLFDSALTNFEHTLPLSRSFDNSLANRTVCNEYYNTKVKIDEIPTKLANYSHDADGYSAIEPNLKKWKDKVSHLKELIDDNRARSRKAQDVEFKKSLIQKRHLLQLQYDYWKKKLDAFLVTEIPNTWKNSQLVDTQIISKYARAYLKTVFGQVEVQKGTIVNEFKKIFQIKGDEQKDRSKHSHHALDAATLTLIPGSAKRELILKKYYIAIENNSKFYDAPYEGFQPEHFLEIENNIIINHISNDRTLLETRKRARQQGSKTNWIATGDTIRGRLHKETFFGAIKALERDNNGHLIKEHGVYKKIKNAKTGEDEIWIVARKPVKDIKVEKGQIKDAIVDELLKRHIQKQLNSGIALSEVVDFNNKPVRHLRVRVKAGAGYLSKEKAITVKMHTYPSKQQHKQWMLTQNEENYLFLIYEGVDERGKVVRAHKILNLFEVAQLRARSLRQIKSEPGFQTMIKGRTTLELKRILRAGDRVILLNNDRDEIGGRHDLKTRLFTLFKFNEPAPGTAYLYLQSHLEARPDNELGKEEKVFIANTNPGLRLRWIK